MITMTAFRAKNPELFEAHVAQRKEAARSYARNLAEFESSVGGRAFGRKGQDGSIRIDGVRFPFGSALPLGWRLKQNRRDSVPNTKTMEGKLLAERLASLSLPGAKLPGLPSMPWFAVQVDRVAADWYLVVHDHRPKHLNSIDHALWEQVPVAEYTAAVKALQAVA
ncbi:hypothetical protein [Arthrobacter sp. A2-55]|uniref:hypothetical protein n=1 Tax=Arthrobacter sp. A2-55 TaxID=2897337 RepID=UPI0021CD77A7|nr:hypothetical protein [Arthrobacter sp. A2-55]MCU6481323.1 hypothetical protein [Arthrobacter sp. A2-55]